MNLAGRLPDDIDDALLSDGLSAIGLDISAPSNYGISAKTPGLLFGLTAFDEKSIAYGVEALSTVFSESRLQRST